MAETHEPLRLLSVQRLLTGRQHLVCLIGDLLRQCDGNAAYRIYNIGDIHTVQLHIGIHIDAEIFPDGIHYTLDGRNAGLLPAVINAVELRRGIGRIVRHIGVTGNLENIHGAGDQIKLEYPVYVRQLAALVHAQEQDSILSLDGLFQIQTIVQIGIQIAFQIQRRVIGIHLCQRPLFFHQRLPQFPVLHNGDLLCGNGISVNFLEIDDRCIEHHEQNQHHADDNACHHCDNIPWAVLFPLFGCIISVFIRVVFSAHLQ